MESTLPTATRGALIVFEGLDRSGKSTQCNILNHYLLFHLPTEVEVVRFPNRSTAIGKLIHSYLCEGHSHGDHTIHLLFSANRGEQARYIKERIEQDQCTMVSQLLIFILE